MKNSIRLLFLVIPFCIYSEELSRKDILNYAFSHAEELKLIKNEMASAHSIEKEYRGKGFPTIEASVNYQIAPKQYSPYSLGMKTGSSISSLMDNSQPGFNNDATIAGALDQILSSFSNVDLTPGKNTIAMKLSLTQPIFAQGKISKGLKIASMYYGTLDLKYKNAQFSLAKDITNAYNSALLADQNRKVRLQAVSLAEETHRLTRARLESGKGNVLDTLNSMFTLQQAKFALRDAEKNRHLAIKNLLTLASMEDGNPDEIQLTDSLMVIDFDLPEEVAFKRMADDNVSLRQIDKGIQMQQMQTKIAKADFLPTVYAGASLSKITMFNNADELAWGDDQKIFVGASVPIFSGGQKLEKVRQANFEEVKLQETRKKTINQLNLALTNYFEELAVAKEECEEALHLIALTTQGANIASLSYEIGQITQIDLTNSKQQLSMSQLAYNSAVHKLNTAIVGIKTLLGDNSLLSAEQEDK